MLVLSVASAAGNDAAMNRDSVIAVQNEAARRARLAMWLSLAAGLLMLAGKWAAYLMTGSAAIFSDAAESVVHVAAVGFASYSLMLSGRPANPQFPYGYEKISYVSAGFEGALIILAAVVIIYQAVHRWIEGLVFEHLGLGTTLIAAASIFNAALGLYLISQGKKNHSLILEANGQHVLTDSWTSFGVVGGLILVLLTGWKPFDPLLAIAVAVNIVWTGRGLIRKSFGGLMDEADPALGATIRQHLDKLTREIGIGYHGVRYRGTGISLWVELHLLFSGDTPLAEAHATATNLEERLKEAFTVPVKVITHLESAEDHSRVHNDPHYEGKPGITTPPNSS
ncbi:MAG: cation transporter [Acidobacteria bacterium]|nr:cation transporter [Acidobacteriota bacterium]